MKRSISEILRRGFDTTVANWPVIALRIVESMLLIALTIAAVVATVVPTALSAIFGDFHLGDVASVRDAMITLLADHWMLVLYAVLMVTVLLIVLVGVHSFFDAGTARVLIDSERVNAQRTFEMSRWLEGGRRAWWPIFWIYNIVWTIAGIILLLPLIPTAAGLIFVRSDGGRVAVACGGLLLTALVFIPTAVVAAVWTQKAIAVCVARSAGALDSMRAARSEMGRDFGRHFAVAFIVIVVSIGGAAVIGGAGAPMSILRHQQPMSFVALAPAQMAMSFLQSVFSAAVGAWFLACFVALTEER